MSVLNRKSVFNKKFFDHFGSSSLNINYSEADVLQSNMKKNDKCVNSDMKKTADKIKKSCGKDKDCMIKEVHEVTNKRYKNIYTRPIVREIVPFLDKSVNYNTCDIWGKKKSYQPCHTQVMSARRLLIMLGFKPKDVQYKTSWTFRVPHQYLKVKYNGKSKDVDIWGADVGVPLGKHYPLKKRRK